MDIDKAEYEGSFLSSPNQHTVFADLRQKDKRKEMEVCLYPCFIIEKHQFILASGGPKASSLFSTTAQQSRVGRLGLERFKLLCDYNQSMRFYSVGKDSYIFYIFLSEAHAAIPNRRKI